MLLLALLGVLLPNQARPMTTAPASEIRDRTAAALARALEHSRERSGRDLSMRLADLRSATELAARDLGDASLVGLDLSRAASRSTRAPADGDTLESLADLVRERTLDLAFAPKVESPRPSGFPDATPVGEIAVLDYPVYRLARTGMPGGMFGGRNGAFWKLFQHIQRNEIPMTAPVEMAYGSDASGEHMRSMAFLYATTQVGKLGTDGSVEVVDVPANRVASLGLRGTGDEASFTRALVLLRDWLAAHPEWVENGAPRAMAWNSPMVPDARRFFEVQIPIRAPDPNGQAVKPTSQSAEPADKTAKPFGQKG
jgi:hypothetical protein